ncbi:CRISPR-associated endonuclease Cas2 [Deferribacterales bacterium Es71-Z0220]|uniref:CRISPR-associated endonuclease Cas2 n=1 Tax=Deferrivibrio essentukiensis TaxID=2880922 RepID=UPI001F5FF6CC|nr:CRISPR-associated endonuclease Cas2 [Deferrivibrio essentukiensis]MCB4205473.1 CRISPR-associated endonuclease Cas2 [Deferrivibrio essentukiensis]
MFIILYYDVTEKKCSKMLKTCRKYLQWVQNSVFEGEISEANLEKLKYELGKILDEEDGDSVIIYKFRTKKYTERQVLGIDKKEDTNFI